MTEIKEKRNEVTIIKEFSLPLHIWRVLLFKGMDPHGKLLLNQLDYLSNILEIHQDHHDLNDLLERQTQDLLIKAMTLITPAPNSTKINRCN